MSFSAASLRAVLEAQTPNEATGLVVALSGGRDSACLAAALAQLIHAGLWNLPVRAVHVNHGLQAAAADFRDSCIASCRNLKMPLTVIEVVVPVTRGESLEAAARAARYAGLTRDLHLGECLLTAHHAADQAETVLLQLLRGAGVKGLSAMPLCRPLGVGWHLRPLLEIDKRDLSRFGEEQGIVAVADPMNADLRFDRAYLRAELWPSIEARWPGAAAALSRSAGHMARAQDVLEQSAAQSVRSLLDGDALSVTGLRRLSASQQLNALRYWVAAGAVTPPSSARLTEALRQMLEAGAQQLPCVVWGDHALRRYRERLFLTPAEPPRVAARSEWSVAPASTLRLGTGLGILRWTAQRGGLDARRLPVSVGVCRRRGGETLRPRPLAKTQSVRHLCQSLGLLPWMRDAVPLIFAGDALIAIGDVWQDARWCVAPDATGLGILWDEAPVIV